MDPYSSPYISIIPRLLPSQYSSKKIPMSDESHQYIDNRPISSYTIPQNPSNNVQLLSSKTDLNSQDNIPYSNQTYNSIPQDNPFIRRNSTNRLHLEALKDNSGDKSPTNSYNTNGYPPNYDYKPYENFKENSSPSKSPKMLIIIFAILIGLFSLTALAISIYLLIRMSTTTAR